MFLLAAGSLHLNLATLRKIADALGVSMSDLFEEDADKE
jgi:DNA-binding Xre family transcriptional regulator